MADKNPQPDTPEEAPQEQPQEPEITQTPAETQSSQSTQSTDQTDFPEDGSTLSGADGEEKIVHDKDEEGNVIGWHKEAQNG